MKVGDKVRMMEEGKPIGPLMEVRSAGKLNGVEHLYCRYWFISPGEPLEFEPVRNCGHPYYLTFKAHQVCRT